MAAVAPKATAVVPSGLPSSDSAQQSTTSAASLSGPKASLSRRVNGKNWHEVKKPFRPTAGLTTYAKRAAAREAAAATKKMEREMKDEKKSQREHWIMNIREKRQAKEERERYAKMEERMHKKRVERLKRREKRNKMLGK